jgi:L-cysteine S-thiosulfotransferase
MAKGCTQRALLLGAALVFAAPIPGVVAAVLVPFDVAGDAIPTPLGGHVGDRDRGFEIVVDRSVGNCLICHQVPIANEPFQGELGPSLAGVGSRLSVGQIRLRMVDQSRLNPATLMPPYYRTRDLTRVSEKFEGAPVLSAQQIEDVVAWLATLKQETAP